MKAKMKGKSINKGTNKEINQVHKRSEEIKINVFAQQQAVMDQLPCIVITSYDPLVTEIKTVIDNELG